jgi:hypothetical protein
MIHAAQQDRTQVHDLHKASDGKTISADCEYCHKQIESAPTPQERGPLCRPAKAAAGALSDPAPTAPT